MDGWRGVWEWGGICGWIERDVGVGGERCGWMKRGVCGWREMWVDEEGCVWVERDMWMDEEGCVWVERRVGEEGCVSGWRGMCVLGGEGCVFDWGEVCVRVCVCVGGGWYVCVCCTNNTT